MLALQSEYLKSQFEALQAQTKDFSEVVQKATGVAKS